jgi:hypothetical protein
MGDSNRVEKENGSGEAGETASTCGSRQPPRARRGEGNRQEHSVTCIHFRCRGNFLPFLSCRLRKWR